MADTCYVCNRRDAPVASSTSCRVRSLAGEQVVGEVERPDATSISSSPTCSQARDEGDVHPVLLPANAVVAAELADLEVGRVFDAMDPGRDRNRSAAHGPPA